jgi:hypothetical protein
MSLYHMTDGTVLNTDKAKQKWEEATRFDGSNLISVNTGSQWTHQALYKSRRGRYYIEHWSQYQGSSPRAEWIDERRAAAWLILNKEELPEDLKQYANEVEE